MVADACGAGTIGGATSAALRHSRALIQPLTLLPLLAQLSSTSTKPPLPGAERTVARWPGTTVRREMSDILRRTLPAAAKPSGVSTTRLPFENVESGAEEAEEEEAAAAAAGGDAPRSRPCLSISYSLRVIPFESRSALRSRREEIVTSTSSATVSKAPKVSI